MGDPVVAPAKESTAKLKEEDRKLFSDLLASIKSPEPKEKEVVLAQETKDAPAKPDEAEPDKAEMEMRIPGMKSLNILGKTAAQIDHALWDIPFGSVVLGLVPGAIVGELIDGLVPPTPGHKLSGQLPNGLARAVGAALVMSKPVKSTIGPTASVVAAATLLTPVVARALPLDKFVSRVVSMLRPASKAAQSILEQADAIVNQGPISGGSQYPGML